MIQTQHASTKNSKRDLAAYHHLVSEMFQWPATAAEWEQHRLTQELLDFFEENGYVSNIKLLEGWQVEPLRSELDQIMDPAHPANDLFYKFHTNEPSEFINSHSLL